MLITSCVEKEKERDENLKCVQAAGVLRTACLAAIPHPSSLALSFTSSSGKEPMPFYVGQVHKYSSTALLSWDVLLLPSPAA